MSDNVYDLLTDSDIDADDQILMPDMAYFVPPEGSDLAKSIDTGLESVPGSNEIFEAIIGTNEIVDHGIVAGLIDRGRSVARIRMQGHKSLTIVPPAQLQSTWQQLSQQGQLQGFVGTGWILGSARKVLLTNHHVLPLEEAAESARLEFGYQRDVFSNTISAKHGMTLDPSSLFVTSTTKAFSGLDYSAVALSQQAPEEFGHLDYAIGNTAMFTSLVYVAQHPSGDPKSYVVNHNRKINLTDQFVTYTSDTKGGSSGSPLFDDELNLIGIHHIGNNTVSVGTQSILTNLGSRIEVVISDLASQLHGNGWDATKVEEWFGSGSVLQMFDQIES